MYKLKKQYLNMKTLTKVGAVLALTLAMGACSQPQTETPQQDFYMFTSFHEPATEGLRFLYSRDGLHWDSVGGTWLQPEIGDSILRDPSMIVTPDSTFHLVWTISWRGNTGFGYARSKDLVHWSTQRRIPAMDSVKSTVNVWAPEWFYDDIRDRYMVIYSSCVPDSNFTVGQEDVNNNHRLYYVTTIDFETFSAPKLLLDPGFSCIDATLVKRGEKDYVMVLKDNTRPNRNLKVAFAQDPEGPYTEPSEPFTGFLVEGPSTVKLGDDYFIYFDDYQNHIYGAVKTRDFASFTSMTDSISIPSGHKHGTIFRAPEAVVESLLEQAGQATGNQQEQ